MLCSHSFGAYNEDLIIVNYPIVAPHVVSLKSNLLPELFLYLLCLKRKVMIATFVLVLQLNCFKNLYKLPLCKYLYVFYLIVKIKLIIGLCENSLS